VPAQSGTFFDSGMSARLKPFQNRISEAKPGKKCKNAVFSARNRIFRQIWPNVESPDLEENIFIYELVNG